MPIKQRCTRISCRAYLPFEATECPQCGEKLSRERRNVCLIKQIGGKRRIKSLGPVTKAQAELAYAEWTLELNKPAVPEPQEMTVSQMRDAYLAKLGAEGSSYERHAALFFERLIDFFGNVAVTSLRPEAVRQFQVHLREVGVSPAYTDRHLAVCKAAWNHAVGSSFPNPFRVKFYHPDNTLIRFLSPEEEAALLDACDRLGPRAVQRFRTIMLVAIRTGLRIGNVLHLHTEETFFDLPVPIIRLRQKRKRLHAVPMTQDVVDALKAIRPQEGGWYFPNPRGKPYTDIRVSFEQAKALAGITKEFRIHDLRHSAATSLLAKTGNLRMVGEMLGHTNPTTTTKYAHIDLRQLADAMNSVQRRPRSQETDE